MGYFVSTLIWSEILPWLWSIYLAFLVCLYQDTTLDAVWFLYVLAFNCVRISQKHTYVRSNPTPLPFIQLFLRIPLNHFSHPNSCASFWTHRSHQELPALGVRPSAGARVGSLGRGCITQENVLSKPQQPPQVSSFQDGDESSWATSQSMLRCFSLAWSCAGIVCRHTATVSSHV